LLSDSAIALRATRVWPKLCYLSGRSRGVNLAVDDDAQAKALRLRMYVFCSECARLIDLAEGNRQRRDVEGLDLVRHAAEEHSAWLEVLGIDDTRD
jgi:hypothetical protein